MKSFLWNRLYPRKPSIGQARKSLSIWIFNYTLALRTIGFHARVKLWMDDVWKSRIFHRTTGKFVTVEAIYVTAVISTASKPRKAFLSAHPDTRNFKLPKLKSPVAKLNHLGWHHDTDLKLQKRLKPCRISMVCLLRCCLTTRINNQNPSFEFTW